MGVGRGIYGVLFGGSNGRYHWEDQGVGGMITLR
jgi:hypothetical protein